MVAAEELWARLGADEDFCRQVLTDPAPVLSAYDLTPQDVAALAELCANATRPARNVQAALFRLLAEDGIGNRGSTSTSAANGLAKYE